MWKEGRMEGRRKEKWEVDRPEGARQSQRPILCPFQSLKGVVEQAAKERNIRGKRNDGRTVGKVR